MNIEKRLIIPLARRGNTGKSTFAAVVAQWFDQNGLEWHGYDADGDHQTFSRLFQENVKLAAIGEEPEGDILTILRQSALHPLVVVDPRAHLSDTIIRTMEMIRFCESYAAVAGRVTVALFPADDLEVMSDADRTVERLGGTVDYVVVRNRARAQRTKMFDGSELEAELVRLGAVDLELPVLLSTAKNHIASHEARLQRGITHLEAAANRALGVDPLIRLAIQDWLAGLFRQMATIAHLLLPSHQAAQVAPPEPAIVPIAVSRRGGRINPNNL